MSKRGEFGSYEAHQPNYDVFKNLGKLDDYIYQSLSHMGGASSQLSWALTVLDHTDVSQELKEELRKAVIGISDIQQKLRELRDMEAV